MEAWIARKLRAAALLGKPAVAAQRRSGSQRIKNQIFDQRFPLHFIRTSLRAPAQRLHEESDLCLSRFDGGVGWLFR
jgi:hypothetical protein